MNCIIIEDQPPAQRILKKYIEDLGTLTLKAVFSDAIQGIDFLKKEEIDLIFLDIHLPRISGIDFLKMLSHRPHIILTTAFPDYALESYELDVVDYLLKPFSFQRFVKAVGKVPQSRQTEEVPLSQEKKEIFIKSGYEHIRVIIADILYIKSDADYTELYLEGKKHLSAEPLRYWLENLDADQFVQVHKSYIINTSQIEKIAGNRVFFAGGKKIPMGRAYKDSFIKRFVN